MTTCTISMIMTNTTTIINTTMMSLALCNNMTKTMIATTMNGDELESLVIKMR
jgi:hypothetical protein